MKVGEAGEAFFVVETDAEVPEELQTSPVMLAASVSNQNSASSTERRRLR
jgi:phosphatidate phosphatase LPIN